MNAKCINMHICCIFRVKTTILLNMRALQVCSGWLQARNACKFFADVIHFYIVKETFMADINMKAKESALVDVIASFIAHTSIRLPDDVFAKLEEMRASETEERAIQIYDLMFENMRLAKELKRPTCQDTGVLQFFVRCGTGFPYLDSIEEVLNEAVLKSTKETPLRLNVVETFSEYNTGTNTGTGVPFIMWEMLPGRTDCEIYTYMAGGGCSLPGQSTVLMPAEGYPAAVKFVMDRMTTYGLNACPPLLVGVGIGATSETAALNAKHALLRPIGSHNENERAARLEEMLEEGINAIGIGPQGMGGDKSVMGVHVVNTARHPATLGVAVTVACWSHRRGCIVFDKDLNYGSTTHSEFEGGAL